MAYDPIQALQGQTPQYGAFNQQRGVQQGMSPYSQGNNQSQGQPGFSAPYKQWQSFGSGGQPQEEPGWFRKFNLGTKDKYQQVPTVTPFASQALNQLLENALRGLQDPNAPASGMEQRARQNFYQQTIPELANVFGASTNAGGSSPSFHSQLYQAGSGFEENLKQGRMKEILQQLELGLHPQFETEFQPGQPGFWEGLWNTGMEAGKGFAKGLGQGVGAGLF